MENNFIKNILIVALFILIITQFSSCTTMEILGEVISLHNEISEEKARSNMIESNIDEAETIIANSFKNIESTNSSEEGNLNGE